MACVDTVLTTWYDFGARRPSGGIYRGISSGGSGKMGDRRFTILIVPDAKSSCRKIKISSLTIFYAFIILAAVGSAGVGTIVYYLKIYRNAQAVRQENVVLQAS